MRNMSFSLTTPQFKARTKFVTRRLGWKTAKAGDLICGVEKAMGLKKGEKMVRLGIIRIVSARRESLMSITAEDCVLEGFPDFTPEQFIKMLCVANSIKPYKIITRIEYEYTDLKIGEQQ